MSLFQCLWPQYDLCIYTEQFNHYYHIALSDNLTSNDPAFIQLANWNRIASTPYLVLRLRWCVGLTGKVVRDNALNFFPDAPSIHPIVRQAGLYPDRTQAG